MLIGHFRAKKRIRVGKKKSLKGNKTPYTCIRAKALYTAQFLHMDITHMTRFNLSAITLAATAALSLSFTAVAEQPLAKDLVGKFYGGGHLMHIKTDNERLMTDDLRSDVDHGSGFGAEFGYRYSEALEFRFAHSEINLVKENGGFKEPDASATAFDVLYFLNKESFYLMSGLNSMDIVDRKTSVNLGAGYRYHLTNNAALYFEGKTHYQFSEHFTDYTAQLGFIYFFGESKKSAPASKVAPVAVVAEQTSAQVMDSDNDGIADNKDQCANTPKNDKVDSNGCTVFTQENLRIQLLVNFDNNKAEIKPEYFNEIKEMADFMKTYPHTKLVVEGHTSSQGSAVHNKKLSQARAQAIVNRLTQTHGIKAERLSAVGYGEARLLNTANSSQAHSENRRIEAVIETTRKVAIKQ